MDLGNPELLQAVHDDLINKDWFMTLLDVEAYIEEKHKIMEAYEDRLAWSKRCLSTSPWLAISRATARSNNTTKTFGNLKNNQRRKI